MQQGMVREMEEPLADTSDLKMPLRLDFHDFLLLSTVIECSKCKHTGECEPYEQYVKTFFSGTMQ